MGGVEAKAFAVGPGSVHEIVGGAFLLACSPRERPKERPGQIRLSGRAVPVNLYPGDTACSEGRLVCRWIGVGVRWLRLGCIGC